MNYKYVVIHGKSWPCQSKRGFTLIEMLVVVAIIGILASMMAPSLMRALETAHTLSCSNNLRQLGIASMSYSNDNSGVFIGRRMPCNGGFTYWPGVLAEEGRLTYQTLLCPNSGQALFASSSTSIPGPTNIAAWKSGSIANNPAMDANWQYCGYGINSDSVYDFFDDQTITLRTGSVRKPGNFVIFTDAAATSKKVPTYRARAVGTASTVAYPWHQDEMVANVLYFDNHTSSLNSVFGGSLGVDYLYSAEGPLADKWKPDSPWNKN